MCKSHFPTQKDEISAWFQIERFRSESIVFWNWRKAIWNESDNHRKIENSHIFDDSHSSNTISTFSEWMSFIFHSIFSLLSSLRATMTKEQKDIGLEVLSCLLQIFIQSQNWLILSAPFLPVNSSTNSSISFGLGLIHNGTFAVNELYKHGFEFFDSVQFESREFFRFLSSFSKIHHQVI